MHQLEQPRFIPLRCVCHIVPVNDVDGGADGDGDGDDDYDDDAFLYTVSAIAQGHSTLQVPNENILLKWLIHHHHFVYTAQT